MIYHFIKLCYWIYSYTNIKEDFELRAVGDLVIIDLHALAYMPFQCSNSVDESYKLWYRNYLHTFQSFRTVSGIEKGIKV